MKREFGLSLTTDQLSEQCSMLRSETRPRNQHPQKMALSDLFFHESLSPFWLPSSKGDDSLKIIRKFVDLHFLQKQRGLLLAWLEVVHQDTLIDNTRYKFARQVLHFFHLDDFVFPRFYDDSSWYYQNMSKLSLHDSTNS